ncbi:phage tail terminator protein [Pseudogulbenkiania ferrooxidans]|uniref:Uncharacterized protein n=1 Tax=Pseudogulbenkiania ferrooxidans 2002 TaxID=279714 RepID=B9YYU7_9NEIS|nr:hypothetical protein [Pseudogulbenkiania ferrooxidans]EEG10300.1 conserved hypothetical protein [Pseudogulbenkiania ferrooxidans 2002]
MKITPIISQLRSYCPSFAGRVAGALELAALLDDAAPLMALPAAYVVPTREDPQSPMTTAPYLQDLEEKFDVVVALAPGDERGQAVADRLHDLRAELWRALLGWSPPDCDPVEYDGGALLMLNRGRVIWRFGFTAMSVIGGIRGAGDAPATWHDVERDGLADLLRVHIDVDNGPVPDGEIDQQLQITLPAAST